MNVRSSPSASEPVMVIDTGVSSSVVTLISSATGASLTAFTVNTNVSLSTALPWASLTVTVMSAVPF